jgi:type IV pilus assembly protein PilA
MFNSFSGENKMKKIQQGFTLIELMIVVAIIGILAAVAIPSYQDYTARAQVSEGMSLTAAFKTTLAEYFADRGDYNTIAIADLGGTTAGKYVASIALLDNTGATIAVQATFKATNVAAAIQSSTFATATTDGGKTWACGSLVPTATATTNIVATKLVPGACK